ncbi:hypothetical protein P9112_012565 [Eukaryota sp. TZLM1-RC]
MHPNQGPVNIFTRLGNNWVLGIEFGRNPKGARVVTQQLRPNDPAQQWNIDRDGTIRHQASGLVMDVERNEIHRAGAGLVLWDRGNNKQNQIFFVNHNGQICVRANQRMCLDVPRNQAQENQPVNLWNCKNPPSPNQTWNIQPAGMQPGGFPGQQPGGFPGQQPQHGGFPGQQPGGFPGQQPQHGGFPGQQPGGFPGQQPGMQPGGFPGQQQQWQQPQQGGFPGQQPGMQPGGFPGQQQQWQQPRY